MDPKDRMPTSSATIPGVAPEVISDSAPMPGVEPVLPIPQSPIETAHPLVRPDISAELAQMGVTHGSDSLRLSDSALASGVTPHIPSTSHIENWPVSIEEAKRLQKGSARNGSTWQAKIVLVQGGQRKRAA